MKKINQFRDDYAFLSNMYDCPVTFEGLTYGSSEAAFQAAKCENQRDRIPFTHLTGREAKRKGRKVVLRKDWDAVRLSVMETVVRNKFTENPDLKDKLLATGNAVLIEGNHWHDTFWGICDGVGENHLGQILMNVRKELS